MNHASSNDGGCSTNCPASIHCRVAASSARLTASATASAASLPWSFAARTCLPSSGRRSMTGLPAPARPIVHRSGHAQPARIAMTIGIPPARPHRSQGNASAV